MSISLFRSIAGQYEHLRDVNTVSMMNTISHHIEDQVINHRLPVEFYAGFQRFSLFPDQMRRYQRLGAVCRRVYVFGVPDVRPPAIPGVEYISLDPTSPLAKEWFVLVDTPEFWTILATQEADGRDPITGGRRFDGIWTFDTQVVERASLLISQALDNFYQPIHERDRRHDRQSLHITEINGRMVEDLERRRVRAQRWRARVGSLQQVADGLVRSQDPGQLLQSGAQVVHSIFGANGVTISLFDENKQLRIHAAEGEATVHGDAIYNGNSPAIQSAQSGQIVSIADTRKGYERDPYLPTAQSLFAVPIIGKSGIHGSIVVGGEYPEKWVQEDGNTIMAFGALLAVGIERQGNGGQNMAVTNSESWQAPMAYLLTMHQKLRKGTPLSPEQAAMMDQIDRLATGLAHAIGVPENTIRRIINS